MPQTKPFLAPTMGSFVLRAGESTRPQNGGTGADALALDIGRLPLALGNKPCRGTQQGRPPRCAAQRHPAHKEAPGTHKAWGLPGREGGRQVGPRLANCPHDGSIQERGHTCPPPSHSSLSEKTADE